MSKSDTILTPSELLTREYRAYSDQTYKESTNCDKLDKPLSTFLCSANLNRFSHRDRIVTNVQILKHTFVNHKSDMIVVCFKLTLDSTSCIYGYLHCECSEGPKSNIKYRYVCTGPTYKSQDGEYRSRVIEWSQFEKVLLKYPDIIAQVEEMVVDKINSGRLTFQTDFYYPTDCNYSERKLEDFINSQRLPIKFFILCWLYDFYSIHNKIVENHIYPAYQYVFHLPEDISLYESLYENIGYETYELLRVHISESIYDINKPLVTLTWIQCGQKLFPLSAIEAVKTDDILFNVWREIYITNIVSNLVLNLVSPSFSFINNWFYIQNAHAGLFDNIAMHDKFAHSEIADNISSRLKLVDKLNYNGEDIQNGPISGKFFRLSRDIHKAVIYANSDIKLTDLAVCMTSEYVGRTLRDMPAIIQRETKMVTKYKSDTHMVFTDIGLFNKHMFEYIYAFYCMNTKLGIVHGDLHMNNTTINRLYHLKRTDGTPIIANPHIVYIINDVAYCMPHLGMFSTIIDFSRAIIGDYERVVHEFSIRYADIYFEDQNDRVLQILFQYFPVFFEKHKDAITKLTQTNFPLMFKIMTAIDTFTIMTNIAAMFSIDTAFSQGKIDIAPGAETLLRKLIDHAEQLMTENILAALEGKISVPEDIEWPNLLILSEHFKSYILDDAKMKKYPAEGPDFNIIEIFNSNNEIQYEIEDYDTWGPLLSIDKDIELHKKYKLSTAEFNDWLSFKKYDEDDILQELTAKYAQKEQEVLEYEQWMLI